MGLYLDHFIARIKSKGIKWFATVTTDAIVAQGVEAGGHRGVFDATKAEASMVGLLSLLPAVADVVKAPVVAAGGIADGRGVAAALLLGASAVQVGTAFLRSPEAKIARAWANAIGRAAPERHNDHPLNFGTPSPQPCDRLRAGGGGAKRSATSSLPCTTRLTQVMREAAVKENDIERMQAWAGQSVSLATTEPAGEMVRRLWEDA
jgi:nitronate monooxygenase